MARRDQMAAAYDGAIRYLLRFSTAALPYRV